MGVDFRADHGKFSLNWHAWDWCFGTACTFGWVPCGTIAPKDHDGAWCGTYFSNDFQTLSDSDARLMAAALRRAISAANWAIPTEQRTKTCQDRLNILHELAQYAEKGGFQIL